MEKEPGTECPCGEEGGRFPFKAWEARESLRISLFLSVESGHEGEHGLCIPLMGLVHAALPMDIGPISSLKKEGRATVLAGDQLQPTLPCSLQAPHAKGHLPCVLFQLAQSQQVAETFCAGPRLAM